MERQIAIKHGKEEIAATIHYPVVSEISEGKKPARVPLIIICHGFVGNRIGVDRLFVKTARELAEDGNLVLRFDYIGCGESTGEYGAEGLQSMINQTKSVLDYAIDCCDVDPQQVTLLGHSLGGATALHTAVRDKRVTKLVLWSAVGYPFNDIIKITGRDKYDTSVKEGAADYLGYRFTPTYFESLADFQPFQEALKFSGDVLVIHGTSDDTIPVDYAFLYQKVFWMRSEGRCDKDIIFQGDHTFSSGPEREQLIKRTRAWLTEQRTANQDWQHWMI
ncbi:alpha/beta hydrolase [Paenibacillus provencensis]|uniref:Alpha/beta hydrolase n=1 Tax=Paenibacillus provencensis TaxID=441151 RepID=A0ABW3PWX9_9BACL|nr:alpha/beta fold hydrolase [Paenibacillus sp. MER 78]MCM3128171.1 alpha/beta fold hydrolase [Paenibacillus sp. MER 78]